jgi:hypothetical protein
VIYVICVFLLVFGAYVCVKAKKRHDDSKRFDLWEDYENENI